MKVTTWTYRLGESGKIMPVKGTKVIDEKTVANVADIITGVELARR